MSPYRVQQALDPEPPALVAPDRESEPPDAPDDSLIIVQPLEQHGKRGDALAAFLVVGICGGLALLTIFAIFS